MDSVMTHLTYQFQNFDGFFFDLDGVIWKENELLPGSKQLIELLNLEKKKVAFLSNNSTKSLEQYISKFKKLGIPASEDQVINSSLVTVEYLNSKNYENKTVFIIGEEGMKETFRNAGYRVVQDKQDCDRVDAVLVGMDRFFTYDKLSTGLTYCLKGADFIGTNPDTQFPTPEGPFPGAGSMIGALESALGYGPEKICGKPDPLMANVMLKRFNLVSKKTVMIGDRVTTDLKLALNSSMNPVLVKTGFGTEEYQKFPDFKYFKVIDSLSDLFLEN